MFYNSDVFAEYIDNAVSFKEKNNLTLIYFSYSEEA